MKTGNGRSADGTPIGFTRLGSGPALIFVHGSLSAGDSWLKVATAMADRFTCFLMDRRGRGLSGDHADYSLDRECEDIQAVVDAAGPGAHLLGHSYGAICALEAAVRGGISRLVLYEPPLPVEGTGIGAHPSAKLLRAGERFRAAVSSGQLDEALTIGLRDMVQMDAAELSALRATPLWNSMAALTPTWPREMGVVGRLDSNLDRHKQLVIPVLLLVGTTTAAHHQVASTALAGVLPDVQTAHLHGQGHSAFRTAPEMVADEVSKFLQAPIRRLF